MFSFFTFLSFSLGKFTHCHTPEWSQTPCHYPPPQTYGWRFHLAQRPFDKWITFHIAYKINQPTGYRKER